MEFEKVIVTLELTQETMEYLRSMCKVNCQKIESMMEWAIECYVEDSKKKLLEEGK